MAELDHVTLLTVIDDITLQVNTTWDYCALLGIAYGASVILRGLFRCLSCARTYLVPRLRSPKDFAKKYGGKWAVVTGASEGIGRSYAIQLAERNMNVLLISRSTEKLEKVAKEIEELYSVETRCHAVDLSDLSRNPETYATLQHLLNGLDVGVLVNNVGTMYDTLQYFLTVPARKLTQIVDLNITATVLLTHTVLPQMCTRNNGAIINISSGSAVQPTPLMTAYSATKSFVDSFTDALEYEYSSFNVTMQSIRPFYVSTQITHKGPPNILLAHPDDYVRSALSTLGWSRQTYGYWTHGAFGCVGEFLWSWLYKFKAVYVHPWLWRWLTGDVVDKKKIL